MSDVIEVSFIRNRGQSRDVIKIKKGNIAFSFDYSTPLELFDNLIKFDLEEIAENHFTKKQIVQCKFKHDYQRMIEASGGFSQDSIGDRPQALNEEDEKALDVAWEKVRLKRLENNKNDE